MSTTTAISGGLNVSGGGTDSYNYKQFYYYSTANGGEWTPTGSGDGYADGSGSVTFSYSGGGAYSNIDSNWEWSPSDTNSPAGTAQTAAWLGQTQNGSWSGSVSASGNATQGYGYSTDSTYTSADGWTSTGTTSASVSGSMSASFLAGSPFASSIGDSYNGASFGGTVSGSGADWANYSFAQSQNLSGSAWSSASGAGAASGGSSTTWGYSGSGSYSQTQDGGTVNGGLSGSGNQTYSLGYNESASMSPGEGWTQSGTGDASATATYGYYYNGSGGGTTPAGDFYFPLGTSWTIRGESGSGGGTYNYNNALTLGEDGWSGTSSTESGNPSVSGTSSQTDSYGYHSSGSTTVGTITSGSINDITENGTTTTTGSGWPGSYATTGTMFGGSGSASGTYTTNNNYAAKPVRDDRPSKRLVVAGQRRLVNGRHHQRHVNDLLERPAQQHVLRPHDGIAAELYSRPVAGVWRPRPGTGRGGSVHGCDFADRADWRRGQPARRRGRRRQSGDCRVAVGPEFLHVPFRPADAADQSVRPSHLVTAGRYDHPSRAGGRGDLLPGGGGRGGARHGLRARGRQRRLSVRAFFRRRHRTSGAPNAIRAGQQSRLAAGVHF